MVPDKSGWTMSSVLDQSTYSPAVDVMHMEVTTVSTVKMLE